MSSMAGHQVCQSDRSWQHMRVPCRQYRNDQCGGKLSFLHASFLDGIGIYSLRAFQRTYFHMKWRSIAELTIVNLINNYKPINQ